jgi:GrpB-like predicted nucleotidyltransferase (UPF0157 family)
MSTIRGQGEWGPAEEEKLRAAWVTEPPRLDGPVRLAEYDPGWPALYEREAARIRSVLGERVLRLEQTYIQQYADAKTEVIAMIMAHIEEEPDS